MRPIASLLKPSRQLLMLIALAMAAPTQVAASPDPQRTVVGRVDGHKFGTNVLAAEGSVSFEADSNEEERLLAACAPGDRCKVVVTTRAGDVVTRLISAQRVADDATSAASMAKPSGPTLSSPSFHCEKALAPIELAICASAELSTLDSRLAQAYRVRLDGARSSTERQAMQQAQREWLAQERAACGIDTACLRAGLPDAHRATGALTQTAPNAGLC